MFVLGLFFGDFKLREVFKKYYKLSCRIVYFLFEVINRKNLDIFVFFVFL